MTDEEHPGRWPVDDKKRDLIMRGCDAISRLYVEDTRDYILKLEAQLKDSESIRSALEQANKEYVAAYEKLIAEFEKEENENSNDLIAELETAKTENQKLEVELKSRDVEIESRYKMDHENFERLKKEIETLKAREVRLVEYALGDSMKHKVKEIIAEFEKEVHEDPK